MTTSALTQLIRPAATAAVALTLLAGCAEPPADTTTVVRPVPLFTITDQATHQLRTFPARIEAREETQLSFRVPGELEQLNVLAGQAVAAGALLALLDDRDYRSELAARQADFDLADADFRRLKTLRERQVVSQADFDNAQARLSAAQVALQMAKDRLADTRLEAPYDGRIAQRLVQNHQSVQAMQPVLVMQDNVNLDVIIQVPEALLSRIQEEQVSTEYQPEVRFAAAPSQSYPVSFKELSTQITPGSQSFEVRFALTNPAQLTVLPGMAATLELDLAQLQPSTFGAGEITVPVTAVIADNTTGQDQVWVYQPDNGTVRPVAVTLGAISQDGVTVQGPLTPGDQIVSAGVASLRDGMAVKPLVRERGI
ncbi:efflux RND transporter periplasmic adaptor subunit [Ferrimonas marina]|uniref:RND family efflux transporter, MFP subunit n=1 Tax=Ferrimonas marina TaxID=299255 RepID=A0A1M5R3R7_9GAMM|nr:efflux RND transporter periplasmic adaptor subunit [Ferrimonas marina]SHH20756.1 RND family efflux transporter, MFP subunit [Ferrimonas marina]